LCEGWVGSGRLLCVVVRLAGGTHKSTFDG